ncbi:hypothetical protein B0H19DRAFT_1264245 [Mycena capillaripes]|nr:hypothetical protein B0H19DRAFT_1264245 [Mycena capillaripes]
MRCRRRFGVRSYRSILIGDDDEAHRAEKSAFHLLRASLGLGFTSKIYPEDLESFIWIFIWEILHHGAFLGLLSDDEAKRLQQLKSTSPVDLSSAKQAFIYAVQFNTLGNLFCLAPFIKILTEWFEIPGTARNTMCGLTDQRNKCADVDDGLAEDLKLKMDVLCLETGADM